MYGNTERKKLSHPSFSELEGKRKKEGRNNELISGDIMMEQLSLLFERTTYIPAASLL